MKKKAIHFCTIKGEHIALPLWMDRRNEYTDKHIDYSNKKIYILQPYCLSVFDLSTKKMQVLLAIEDFNHAKSSIKVVENVVLISEKIKSLCSRLKVWNINQKKVLLDETIFSWSVLYHHNRSYLHMNTVKDTAIVDLQDMSRREILAPKNIYPDHDGYDRCSKTFVHYRNNMLEV